MTPGAVFLCEPSERLRRRGFPVAELFCSVCLAVGRQVYSTCPGNPYLGYLFTPLGGGLIP
jgi:hypothetical protein